MLTPILTLSLRILTALTTLCYYYCYDYYYDDDDDYYYYYYYYYYFYSAGFDAKRWALVLGGRCCSCQCYTGCWRCCCCFGLRARHA